MTRTPTRPHPVRAAIRAAASAALLAAGAILLTACSSTTSANAAHDGPSAAASATPRNQGLAAYRQCLSQHGVTLPPRPSGRPSGAPGGGGFGGFGRRGAAADPARQKAMRACATLRPRFNGRGGRGGFESTALKAFTSCLKDHGIALPRGLRGLNTADPKTRQAFRTCRPLLPQRRPGAPAPSTTPSA